MPPSGFSQKAINGLLQFIKAGYEDAKTKHNGTSLSEGVFLRNFAKELENKCPQNISEEGIKGLAIFMAECYKDLANEIKVGQDVHGRSVIEGRAIDKELNQIGNHLIEFTL